MSARRGTLAAVVLVSLVVAAVAAFLVVGMRDRATAGPAAGIDVSANAPASLLWVDASSRVRQAPRTGLSRSVTGPVCQRVDARAGTMGCLRNSAVPGSAELVVTVGSQSAPAVRLDLWGTANRLRVSPSGRLVGWTVFREGDSYMRAGQFSTTAGIYDLRTKTHYGSLEDFTTYVDGKPYTAMDVNFWGVTFAADDNTFYATLGTGGHTYLLKGDLAKRELRTIRDKVECPSLSPDGTRIAYKFRIGDEWRLHVLTLATATDQPLADTGNVDDQPAWLDNRTVGYGRNDGTGPAVWSVRADGTGQPTRLTAGSSPSALGW